MFTDDERHVIDLTVELTNSFAALPVEHPDDINVLAMAIHRIQDMVLSRPGRREINAVPPSDSGCSHLPGECSHDFYEIRGGA